VNNLPSTITYSIKTSRRKTLALYVKNGQVEVRSPLSASQNEIQAWVNSKTQWIKQQLAEQQLQAEQKPRIEHEGELLFLGKPRKIICAQGKSSVLEDNNNLIIKHTNKTDIHKLLEKWLKEEARLYLTERVNDIAITMNETQRINGIQFRKTKSKWGHCTSKGILQFNWLIIMAPPDVIDYLIIHELSHLQHMNHSNKFWQHVEKFCNDYKTQRNWLRDNGHRLWF
jgi:hypothetical protein